jgi:hypothetical protein
MPVDNLGRIAPLRDASFQVVAECIRSLDYLLIYLPYNSLLLLLAGLAVGTITDHRSHLQNGKYHIYRATYHALVELHQPRLAPIVYYQDPFYHDLDGEHTIYPSTVTFYLLIYLRFMSLHVTKMRTETSGLPLPTAPVSTI